jgi:hypothetical protein
MMRITLILTISLMCHQLSAQRVFNKSSVDARPTESRTQTIYLIGDAGEDPDHQSGMDILTPMLAEDSDASVIFLGDNIYPRGLHGKKHELRAQDERRIIGQMEPLKDHEGKVIFIPGNHDWEQGGEHGLKMIKRQQKFVEKYLGEDDNFMPDKGCPGPKVEEMGDLVIIAIDTQWWLHRHKKSIGEADGCDVLDEAAFMVAFKDALKKYRTKHVLVIGHHPLRSNGSHGGKFSFKEHLFPLTSLNEKAYVPLPVIGSIYPLYRSMLGDIQDIAHPINTEMTNALLAAINEYENVVYACGHEHNLQYFAEKDNHLVVSGSGSKVTHLGNSKKLGFGAERNGFARLSYYDGGMVWLEYFAADESNNAELLFSKEIYTKDLIDLTSETVSNTDYSNMTATVVGDSSYEAKGMKRLLMGSLNRELWLRPLEVPYLDLHKEKGGLTPIQVGGGMQSKSIRLKGGDGQQYVVRQIKKNATFLVAKNMRNTFAQEVIYDGIAGSHPYASIVIGRLSDPVGIYHTNPKLVFLPKDPVLGDLQDEFGDSFCLFEERPNKDMSHLASVGKSKKVVGYNDMVEKVHEKSNHRVDERFTLRSRLFDMLIGDWDRHDDQWRWASFKGEEVTLYRPIPRDRDQAFFKFDGLLPNISNRKWLMRKFQKYGPEIRDIKGQNFNARYFDRSWLTQMSREDWKEEALYIQSHISDEDIDAAVDLFPQTAKEFNGDYLRSSLRARRDDMLAIADRYYLVLAKSVKVVGKTGADYFSVKRQEDGAVAVSVCPLKDGKPQLDDVFYSRTFFPNETKEIILYGLDGKDQYVLEGKSKKSILVRIVGGEEHDLIIDKSSVSGLRKMTKYYDDQDRNVIVGEKELKTDLRKEKHALQYDRKDFVYDTYMPLPSLGFNPDDGVYLGAAIQWTSFGFDKNPFKAKQSAMANYAFKTGAFNLRYLGHFTELFKPFDFGITARANFPFVFDYNGAGNETEALERQEDNVRLNRIELSPYISLSNRSGSSTFKLSAHAKDYRFDDEFNDDGIAADLERTEDTFLGLGLSYDYVNVDNVIAPHRGVRFSAGLDRMNGLDDSKDEIEFTRIKSALSLYFPLDWMPSNTTLALRSGLEHLEGDFNFYQSAFIGGQEELRGVNRNRYAGNTSQFNNAELRVDLKQVNNHTLPFRIGIMGHYDVGRVWLENEESDLWHNAYGGGVYFDILGFITLNATYSIADDGEALLVQGGFLF